MADTDASLQMLPDFNAFLLIQASFARILEILQLKVDDFPKISETVFKLANASLTLHDNCKLLFSKYRENGSHILNTLVQMIQTGIDLDEPTITAGVFEQMESMVSELLEETKKVYTGYIELVPLVEDLQNKIRQQNEEYATELRRKYEEACDNFAKQQRQRDSRDNRTYIGIDILMATGALLFVASVNIVPSVVRCIAGGAVLIIGTILTKGDHGTTKRDDPSTREVDPYQLAKNEKDRLKQELENRTDILDMEIVEPASVSLTEILQQIDVLVSFWQRMLNNIRPLASPAGAADIHQRTRRNVLRDTLLRKTTLTETGWRTLIKISKDYIKMSSNDLDLRCEQLYQFVVTPIKMPKPLAEQRIANIQRQIQFN